MSHVLEMTRDSKIINTNMQYTWLLLTIITYVFFLLIKKQDYKREPFWEDKCGHYILMTLEVVHAKL